MYNSLQQNESSLQDKMNIFYKITDSEKENECWSAEVSSIDFLR